ncbi:hypothetical protein Y032_0134g1849 [Ancylostoma ceylanicum]|nr:hypothetical protein Y032_0134g1849 [Ancylostoma ceylanicum]
MSIVWIIESSMILHILVAQMNKKCKQQCNKQNAMLLPSSIVHGGNQFLKLVDDGKWNHDNSRFVDLTKLYKSAVRTTIN